MKPQNNKEIYQSYWEFSGYLAACVLVGVFIYFFYTKTVETEVNRIVDKTEEYDKIYVRQNELADRIDSLYLYAGMFNTNMNDALLMNAVSKRKQEIMSSIENMNSRDVRMCQKLMSEVNTFLSIKDSIRMMKQEEDLVLNDLRKCIDDNKQTTRKLTIGGITLEK